MFNKVKDVLQIRRIERTIARKLTELELSQIDDNQEVLVKLPNGDWHMEKIRLYDLSELMPSDYHPTIRKKIEPELDPISRKKKKAATPNVSFYGEINKEQEETNKARIEFLKGNNFVDIEDANGNISSQEIQYNEENVKYFERVAECLHDMEREGKQFKEPTDKYIIEKHCFDGQTDREIAKFLESDENKDLKPWGKSNVSKRRGEILKGFGITPKVFNN